MVLPVSGKGECWDSAVAGSFFAAIKRELINDRAWPTRAGLHRAVFDHSKAGTTAVGSIPPGLSKPAEYELTHCNAARSAAST